MLIGFMITRLPGPMAATDMPPSRNRSALAGTRSVFFSEGIAKFI